MKNIEKALERFKSYIPQNRDFINDCEFGMQVIYGKQFDCPSIDCGECLKNAVRFLNEEYKEPIRLTRNEKAILESVNKNIKWITRNKYNNLELFDVEPHKNKKEGLWWNEGMIYFMNIFNHLFQFIQWSDEEPYSIEELLKCAVKEDD